MSMTVDQIAEEALALPSETRAILADRLVESLTHDIPAGIAAAQIVEVRQRVAEVESGNVSLIPGDAALAQVRRLIASAPATK